MTSPRLHLGSVMLGHVLDLVSVTPRLGPVHNLTLPPVPESQITSKLIVIGLGRVEGRPEAEPRRYPVRVLGRQAEDEDWYGPVLGFALASVNP